MSNLDLFLVNFNQIRLDLVKHGPFLFWSFLVELVVIKFSFKGYVLVSVYAACFDWLNFV